MNRLALVVTLFLSSIALAQVGSNDTAAIPGAQPVILATVPASTTCVIANAVAGSQATATIPAQQGQFFYVSLIVVAYSAIAAPAATLMATTSTNLPGTMAALPPQAMQAAVGENTRIYPIVPALKANAASTAVTVVGMAGTASISQSLTLCGYYAR